MGMHRRVTFAIVLTLLLILPIADARQKDTPVTVDAQALAVLRQAAAALQGATPVTDVMLSGSARRIAGSDDEVGTVIVKALGTGPSRVDLNLPSGQRSEIRNIVGAIPTGSWKSPDGVSHKMPFHNVLSEPAWFFPLFAVSRGLSPAGYVATYVGRETRGDATVEHLSISQVLSVLSVSQSSSLQPLSQVEIYFDSTTFLPSAVTFAVHPDDNELLDIPIEISFGDYRVMNGVRVPFHVQRFLNNGLVLDLQFQNVTFNSGFTGSQFTAQ
jgi:hypothetical protein